jgi:hypothetical protein
MAPEEFADEAKCARKSDVYVFGVTVCEGALTQLAQREGRGDYIDVKRLVLGSARIGGAWPRRRR